MTQNSTVAQFYVVPTKNENYAVTLNNASD